MSAHVLGTDVSANAAQFAKLAYGLDYVSDCRSLPAHSFDVVRASHVLEHVPEPASFLSELRRLVKPGGVVQIVVPNNEPLLNGLVNAWRSKRSDHPNLALSVELSEALRRSHAIARFSALSRATALPSIYKFVLIQICINSPNAF